MGDQNARRVTKGVEDLDFFIGDEAFDASGYAVKVSLLISVCAIPTLCSPLLSFSIPSGTESSRIGT